MGKDKGSLNGKKKKGLRHDPLHVQMQQEDVRYTADPSKGKGSARREKARLETVKGAKKSEDEQFVSEKMSKKILEQARRQQEEIEEEENPGLRAIAQNQKAEAFSRASRMQEDVDSDAEEEERESEEEDEAGFDDRLEQDLTNLNAEDEEALSYFMSKEAPNRITLANIIMDKVKEKETEIMTLASERGELVPQRTMNPKVVAVYEGVGKLLSRYRAGAVPKAFKIIPSLENWEEILFITNPDSWSYQAMFQATRIFASNLNAKMAQRFFNLVLLPRVRDDFEETKKLNYHLYMALKKALYKPAAFFKGILLPICEARDCSLREAAIIGSVITKVSIPMLHSSAALLKIVEMEYSGVNSLFVRVLLDKKYALPFRVIDALVFHFIRFQDERRQMPVLWHQALLVFIQRYKEDITSEQKEAILELVKKQQHYSISAEVRREITNSKSRGEIPLEEDIDLDFGYTSD